MCPEDTLFSWSTFTEEFERLVKEGRRPDFVASLEKINDDSELRDKLVRFVSDISKNIALLILSTNLASVRWIMDVLLYGLILERRHASEPDSSMIFLELALQQKLLVISHVESASLFYLDASCSHRYQSLHGSSKIVDTTIHKWIWRYVQTSKFFLVSTNTYHCFF